MTLQWNALEPPIVAMDRVWTLEARQHEYLFRVGYDIAPWEDAWYAYGEDVVQWKIRFDVIEDSASTAKAYAAAWLRDQQSPSRLTTPFSHTRDDWETPQDLFDELNEEFHFTLDVAASPENAKCDRYFTAYQDGLVQDWGTEICWANPPYGLILRRWVQKAYESSKAGATVVMLLPASTSARWWHQFVEPYAEYCFLPRRVKFVGGATGARFDSVLVIFRPSVG
jgi:phage N-6-adenine-methyltransferase